jgi:hypothetical protein
VLKIDTGLAEKSLESLDVNTGCFVPHNLKFTHFTADNIEINDSTLDGKNIFMPRKWRLGNVELEMVCN